METRINVLGTDYNISANKGKVSTKWSGKRYQFAVTVENVKTGAVETFNYWDSEANFAKKKNTLKSKDLVSAFCCFVGDGLAYADNNDVLSFAEEFGYKDFNKARKVHKACEKAKMQFDDLTDNADIWDFYNELVETYDI